jgi:hypothetical protein
MRQDSSIRAIFYNFFAFHAKKKNRLFLSKSNGPLSALRILKIYTMK